MTMVGPGSVNGRSVNMIEDSSGTEGDIVRKPADTPIFPYRLRLSKYVLSPNESSVKTTGLLSSDP